MALVGVLAFIGFTKEASALPMFATQTGIDCMGCHTQHMPRLNKFGRKFAASGMTISQEVKNIDNDRNTDINPSILIKSKYAKTWDKPDGKGNIQDYGTNEGESSPIRMATLYIGGRLTENTGGMLNLGSRKEEGESISGKVTYSQGVEDGYWGTTFYSNATQGPFSGMEFYNTGLYKPLRTFDMRIYSNAAQSTQVGSKGATGVQMYYDKDDLVSGGDHFFITVGMYTPSQDNADLNMADNILPFARIAYEHPIGDYNLMIGAFAIVGGEHVSDVEELSIKRETYGMDIQLEGTIAEREASLTMTNIFKNKVDFTGLGAQLTDHAEDIDNESYSVEATLSLTPDIIAKLGYMSYDDHYVYLGRGLGNEGDSELKNDAKDLDYAINVGLDYGFSVYTMPMKLALEYAWMNPYLDRVKEYQSFMATLSWTF